MATNDTGAGIGSAPRAFVPDETTIVHGRHSRLVQRRVLHTAGGSGTITLHELFTVATNGDWSYERTARDGDEAMAWLCGDGS